MRIIEKAQLMSAAEVDRTLRRVAHEIVEKSGGTKHLALIGIRRRGVPLAQRIAQRMRGIDGVDVPVGTLDITLYRDDLSKVAPQAVLQSSDIPFGVDGMDLVLVDDRSEEHTSELQSPLNLVCRLLLEKKKKRTWYFDRRSGKRGELKITRRRLEE